MTVDTQKLRQTARLMSSQNHNMLTPQGVDEIVAAADHIDAQEAEIERLTAALRKIESVGGDATSGDGHARCKQIASAALSGEGN